MAIHEAYAWLCRAYGEDPTPTREAAFADALADIPERSQARALAQVESQEMPSPEGFAALCRTLASEDPWEPWVAFMERHPMSTRAQWPPEVEDEYHRVRGDFLRSLGRRR